MRRSPTNSTPTRARAVIDWLACLIDLSFDPSGRSSGGGRGGGGDGPVPAAGHAAGIERYVEIYRHPPRGAEAFLRARPGPLSWAAGARGRMLWPGPPWPTPAPTSSSTAIAHRFTVLVYLDDRCDREVVLS
jgi:hypothetical protein